MESNLPLLHMTKLLQRFTLFWRNIPQCAVGQCLLKLVPWLFFIAETVSLVLMELVMMLEQSAHIFLRLGPLLGAWGAPGGPLGAPNWPKWVLLDIVILGGPKLVVLPGSWLDLGGIHPDWCIGTFKPIWKCHRRALEQPKMTPNCHKWGLWGHKLPRRPQIGGTAWIYVYGAIFNIFAQKWPYGSFGTWTWYTTKVDFPLADLSSFTFLFSWNDIYWQNSITEGNKSELEHGE